MINNLRVVENLYVNLINQEAFENLGFNFKTKKFDYSVEDRHFKGEELIVTFPVGWTLTSFNDDGFTADILDEKGFSQGRVDFGCYPNRKGYMWLLREK